MATKKVVKKPIAKKPVAKKATAKKPTAKKPVAKKPAVKKPVAKKAAKKPAVKKTTVKKPEKAKVKRVSVRIASREAMDGKYAPSPSETIDTQKAVAFAMSIAREMKRSAAAADQKRNEELIRLTRRPTTRAHGEDTNKFPESDLKEFRKRLLDVREKVTRGANAMRAAGFNESEDHEADGGDGTNQTLRLQALGQVGNLNRTLQQIEEALHRINDGTYGVCTSCGQLIRKPRLINQPFVLTCMECQSEMERSQR